MKNQKLLIIFLRILEIDLNINIGFNWKGVVSEIIFYCYIFKIIFRTFIF